MVFDCLNKHVNLIIGLTSLTCFLSISFLSTNIWRMHRHSSMEMESIRHCIPCDKLRHPLYTHLNSTEKINALRQPDNNYECCGSVISIMTLLINKEVSEQYYGPTISSPSSLGVSYVKDCELEEDIKTPKARLVGVVDSVPSFIVQGHSKLRWNKNSRTFTANECIHLELEGEIFIRKPGYYLISSTLNVNTTGTYDTTITFSHHVNLLSHRFGTTGVLMQRKRSIKDRVFTSLISAVFKLQMYDRISVSVSHPEYISLNSSPDNFIAYYSYDLN